MAKLTEIELKKSIKEQNVESIYYLYGNEKLLVRHYTDKLTEKIAGKSPSEFSCHVFSGADDMDQIAIAANVLPFMGGKNYVNIKDLDASKLSDAAFAKLMELLKNLPDTTSVVISALTITPDMSKAKNKKLVAEVARLGVVAELNKMSQIALEKQLMSWARKQGATLTEADAGRLVTYCGTDLSTLQNELEKLCAYAYGREITREDIEKTVVKNLEARVFDLSKFVLTSQYDKAFAQLDMLFYQKEEPVSILAVLASAYVDMYRVRVAVESGKKAVDVAACFDYKRKEFRLTNAQRYAKGLPTAALRESLAVLIEADERMKSTPCDKQVLLQELIVKLMLLTKKEYDVG
ncbi:MAG: DNA polymerase III subunit delta [Acutalibacteraceae bacterium]|nr:DNA polymerase III subunit delta [Acutalibacteraceae bacterium]HIR03137.1 DNA polymerase III subunit delta [Candidatus Scatovicinus merdipullorum]